MPTSTLRPFTQILILFFFVMLIFGCSSGGNNSSPILPDETQSTTEITGSTAVSGENNHFCLLYNMIYFDVTDPDDPQYEIVPVRGNSIHLNILKFLETGPCANCFHIEALTSPQPGVLDFNIRIIHPFTDLNLSIFDVRGIIMFNGSHVFPESGLTISDPAMGDGGLLNADGYTALYNGSTMGMAGPLFTYYPGKKSTPVIPNADLNGFKRYRDQFTRNLLMAGWQAIESYSLRMPAAGQFALGYAVDASWAMPINQPVEEPETDFGPDANCTEAWKIKVTDYYPGLTSEGGTTTLKIYVYDWQGYDDAHPVIVECPDLFDGEIQAQLIKGGPNSSHYEVTIENTNLAGEGEHLVLIRKEAAENDPVSEPWLDLTAYQVAKIKVNVDFGTPVDVTPPWLNMNPNEICVDGNYAYMACGFNGLHIVDISDPVNPVWVNRVDTHGDAVGVALAGGYAYVPNLEHYGPSNDDFSVIDIEPVESAHIVNTVHALERSNHVSISGEYAYVSGSSRFSIVDITDPVFPTVIKTIKLNNGLFNYNSFGKITASGGYAYVGLIHFAGDVGGGGSTSYSFAIYDIDPPGSAYKVKSFQIGGFPRDIVVSGGYAYISCRDLAIIDIDPPESAYLYSYASLTDRTTALGLSGNYAYVTDSKSGLEIFDIEQPDSPYLVNTIDTPGKAEDVSISGDYAFIADEGSGLQIIDIGQVGSSYIVSSVEMLVDAYGVDVSEGYAYVAGENFQIINIEQPELAYIVNTIETISDVDEVKVAGGYAYVAGENFQIIDIDPPESAYIVNTLDINARQIAIAEGYAYVVRYDLEIIDIDPPESAYIVNSVDMPLLTYGVAVAGGYAYVTARDSYDDPNGEFTIIDVEPPESAYIVNSVTTLDEWVYGVAVAGDYAYVASRESDNNNHREIKIIDIEPPESAFIYNTIGTGDWTLGIKEYGGYVYAINGEEGIRVIDVDPPESPYYVSSIETTDFTNDIAVSGGYAYIADENGGLRIIQLF